MTDAAKSALRILGETTAIVCTDDSCEIQERPLPTR